MSASGMVDSVRGIAFNMIGHVRTRLELFGLELAEEKARLVGIVMAGLLCHFFICVAVALAILMVVATYWDTSNRLASIGWMLAVAIAAIVGCGWFLFSRIKAPSSLFKATLSEFAKDHAAMSQANDKASS